MPGVVTAGRVVDDRYRLLEAIEEGGMGILWRAEDLITERYVTVKELRFPDPLDHMQRRALAARVRREARAMAAVEHPGLARIVDVVDDGDRPWVVTELIDAPTLAQLVSRQGPLAPDRVAAIGLALLDVLEAAHAQDMVHRFLQPTKVFVADPPAGEEGQGGGDGDGGPTDVRVADFGISSLIGDPAVATNGNVGGVAFMAPEQAGTPEADVWSLGAVLYFAVEGVPPFGGGAPTAILQAMATEGPRPPVRCGPLGPVLDATLVKDPSARAGADDLRAMLEEAAGPSSPSSPSSPAPDGVVGDEAPVDDAIVWTDVPGDADAALEAEVALWGVPAETDDDPADAEAVEGVEGVEAAEGVEGVAETDAATDVDAMTAAEPAPPAEDEPPPPPLAPREALARMFSPDPGRPAPQIESAHDDPQPPPPWPVAHRRSLWTIGICALVMGILVLIMVTNGRHLFSSENRAARTIASVEWADYTDPDTGFRIEYPEEWIVTHEGIYTDFRHPASAAALRVVAQPSSARSAEQGWLELEERFRKEQPSYRRIRLEPKPFRGLDAAEWEFVYTKSGVDLHNLDLGVVTGRSSFALNFETRARNWTAVEPFFERFASSFRPPPA